MFFRSTCSLALSSVIISFHVEAFFVHFRFRLVFLSMLLCSPSIASRCALWCRSRKKPSPHFLMQTRMQVFSASPVAVYSGVGNAFTRISSTEGARALWRGVSSVVLGAGPAHAVHFGTLEAVKELAGGNEAGNQWVAHCTFSQRFVML